MQARDVQALLQAGARSDVAMSAAMETLRGALQKRAARENDAVRAGDWAAAVLDVMRMEADARALNMDRAQTLAAAIERVARLAPSAGEAR
jgi:hypothetical protein